MSAGERFDRSGLLRRIADFIFGYDFFLSYSHGDGTGYPQRLKQRLQEAGFSVFLDQTEYVPGLDLRQETRRQVRKSKTLIVVARPHALDSDWVQREVDVAVAQQRPPVMINVNGAIQAAPETAKLAQEARDRHWIRLDESIQYGDGDPSAHTISELIRGFKHTRQETVRVRAMAGAAGVFAVIATVAALLGWTADVQRARAEKTLAVATTAANDLVFKIEGKLKERLNVPQDVTLAVLNEAELLTTSLAKISTPTPDLLRSSAVALGEIAVVLREQGEYARAISVAQESVDTFKRLVNIAANDKRYQADLVVAYNRLGDILSAAKRPTEATAAFGQCDAIAARLDHDEPGKPEWQVSLALCREKLGQVLVDAPNPSPEDLTKAKGLLDQSLALRTTLAADGGVETERELSVAHERIGDLALKQNDAQTARSEFEQGMGITSDLASANPERTDFQRDVSVLRSKLGKLDLAQKRYPEAAAHFRESLRISQDLAATDKRPDWQVDVAESQVQLADALQSAGGKDEARKLYQDALALTENVATDRPEWPRIAYSAQTALGDDAKVTGQITVALTHYQAALAIARKLVETGTGGDDMPLKLVFTVKRQAEAELSLNQPQTAWAAHEALLADLDRIGAARKLDPATRSQSLGNFAWYAMLASKFDRAIAVCDQALALAPDTDWMMINRADALMLAGRLDEARKVYLAHNDAKDPKAASWAKDVRDDFSAIRKAGLDSPLIDEVGHALVN